MNSERPLASGTRGTPRIRILVADDHTLDRTGLVALLARDDGFEVVAETTTVENTIERCRTLQPDVIILALKLCSQEEEPAVPAILSRLPEARILALAERDAERCLVLNPPWRKRLASTPAGPPPTGTNCLQLAAAQGAVGTLRRNADPQDLALAVRMIARGQTCHEAAAGAIQRTSGNGSRPGLRGAPAFSGREMQVAALLVEAHSNKEIASLLGIREPTVKKHVRHILGKLGLQDRLQAGLYLARNPLLLKP